MSALRAIEQLAPRDLLVVSIRSTARNTSSGRLSGHMPRLHFMDGGAPTMSRLG